jgi:broad specificity phosphatase PhoE
MIDTIDDIDVLPVGVDSLSDYTPNKLHLLLTSTVPLDIITSRNRLPVNIDVSINSTKQSRNKSKTPTKKRSMIRYFTSSNRPRSSPITHSINYYEQEKNHHYQQQQQQLPLQIHDDHDMRLFIIRHGERVDRFFGPNWFTTAFDQHGQYRPYHINLPAHLPTRSNKYYWAFDTPLTQSGLNAAQNLGQVLKLNRFQPTHVYSSPATRCIFTTIQILKGLGLDKKLSIRIEPGLLELGAARFGMNIFFQPIDWHKYGVNVDLSYRPIVTDIPPFEREDAYYLRSKYVIRELEKHHHNSSSQSLNILIVAHATSPDTLTWDLVGRQPNINDLYTLSLNIGYLQMVITERKRENKFWSLKQMPLQSATLKWI